MVAVSLATATLWSAKLCLQNAFSSGALAAGVMTSFGLLAAGTFTVADVGMAQAASRGSRGPGSALLRGLPATLVTSVAVSGLGLAILAFAGRMGDPQLQAAGYGAVRKIEVAFMVRDAVLVPVFVVMACAAGVLVESTSARFGLVRPATKLGLCLLWTVPSVALADIALTRGVAAYARRQLVAFADEAPKVDGRSYTGFGAVLYACCIPWDRPGPADCRMKSCRDEETEATTLAVDESAAIAPLGWFWLPRPTFKAALYGEETGLLERGRRGGVFGL